MQTKDAKIAAAMEHIAPPHYCEGCNAPLTSVSFTLMFSTCIEARYFCGTARNYENNGRWYVPLGIGPDYGESLNCLRAQKRAAAEAA